MEAKRKVPDKKAQPGPAEDEEAKTDIEQKTEDEKKQEEGSKRRRVKNPFRKDFRWPWQRKSETADK